MSDELPEFLRDQFSLVSSRSRDSGGDRQDRRRRRSERGVERTPNVEFLAGVSDELIRRGYLVDADLDHPHMLARKVGLALASLLDIE